MRIFINEIIKVFSKKSVIAIMLVLVILNSVILNVNENNRGKGYKPSEYRAICNDLESMTTQNAYENVSQKLKKLYMFTLFESGESAENNLFTDSDSDIKKAYEEYKSGNYLEYTNAIFSEIRLYTQLKNELESCTKYAEYLQSINDNAEKMISMSIFSEPGTFSYNNISKTPQAYENLKGTKLEFGASSGVKMATSFLATDIIAVIMIMVIVSTLVTKEKELCQLGLVKTTYKGRYCLATSKLLVAFLGCFIVLILLYSGNFLVSYKTYGFGEISRQIQSIYGFVGSTLNITVKEFFVLFLVSKLFVYFAFAAIIYFVSVISKSSIGMYISLVIIFAIQSVMYYTIPQTSYLSAFGNLNIVSFLNTSSIFERYRNLNFLEEAVSCIPVFIIGTLSTIVIFSIIGVVAFSKQVSFGKSKISTSLQAIVDKLSIIKGYKTTNLFLHECYKIFIGGKVILILLAFGLSIWYFYTPLSERFESSTEAYYKHYMIKYEGALTDEKQSDIDAEAEYFDKLQMDLNKASTESNGNNYNIFMAYQEELIPFPAFQLLQQHAEYLSGTNKGEFVYDSGYKLLTGDQSAGNKDIRLALISMTMLIAGLTYVYSIEYNTGASILLRSSRNGRNKTFATKLIISVFITTAIFILTYAPYFYNVLKAYGTNGILAPANSMDHLANIPDSISIKSYLILISVSRYLIMLVAMIVIFSISKRLKSFISALVLETTVLILPLLLSLLGIKVFDYILLNPFIIANLF